MPPKLYIGSVDGTKKECSPTEKPKRTLSDETKAKLAEARQRKKEEKAAALEQVSLEKERLAQEATAKETEAARKKEAAAAKRRETRLKRKAEATASDGTATPEPETKKGTRPDDSAKSESDETEPSPAPSAPKKPRKTSKPVADSAEDGEAPPPWFSSYITKMLNEKHDQEGSKVSKKERKAEGLATAKDKWEDKYTRDRIRNAVDGHMGEMYSMIFA